MRKPRNVAKTGTPYRIAAIREKRHWETEKAGVLCAKSKYPGDKMLLSFRSPGGKE
jgi:hypothetical protein